ncbi:MAG: hypothetical protein ACREJC_20305, partial [Tepidisphaeraceae bacterium]
SEPLVLIGHSYGADDVVRVARELNRDRITVDLIVTLDPVTPPAVPSNVRRCVNMYQPNGMWDNVPFFRGVELKAENAQVTVVENLNIRDERKDLLEPGTGHFNIEKKGRIHQEIINQVLSACPERQQWAAMRSGPAQGNVIRASASIPPTRSPAPTGSGAARPVAAGKPPVASGQSN